MKINMLNIFPFLKTIEMDDYYRGGIIKKVIGSSDVPKDDIYAQGYLSNGIATIIPSNIKHNAKTITVNKEAAALLSTLPQLCKKNGIKLILTYAPEYDFQLQKDCKNAEEILSIYKNLALKNSIPFFRNDSLTMCKNASLFANAGHVNKQGSAVYSRILCSQISNTIVLKN